MQLRPHQIRILNRMRNYNKGQVIVPTGGGKTMCMIQDAAHSQQSKCGSTTIVVAPRILLAEQLCSEFLEVLNVKYTHVMHVHSGETHHYSTTKADNIHVFANTAREVERSNGCKPADKCSRANSVESKPIAIKRPSIPLGLII